MQTMLLADLEPLGILGLSTLSPNVLRKHFIGYVPARTDTVAPCPQVLAPEFLAQTTALVPQGMRAFALTGLHHAARSQGGRYAQEQGDMVGPDMARHNLNVVAPTNLADQVPHLLSNLASQDRLAVLGGKNEMLVQLIDSVGGSTVRAHARQRTASLLKASPEGEGFRPPRRRQ